MVRRSDSRRIWRYAVLLHQRVSDTSLLYQEFGSTGQIAIGSFYARRFLRLMPALFVMVAIVAVAYWLVFEVTSPAQCAAALLYYMNYYVINGGAVPLPIGPLWSLSVEEHYYLVFPIIMFLSIRWWRRFLVGMIALCMIVLAWRITLVLNHADELRTYVATDTRIDSILYGAILAILVKMWTCRSRRRFRPPGEGPAALAPVSAGASGRKLWRTDRLLRRRDRLVLTAQMTRS